LRYRVARDPRSGPPARLADSLVPPTMVSPAVSPADFAALSTCPIPIRTTWNGP